MALIYDVLFDSQTRVLSLLDKAGNVISSCEVPSKDVDDITKPLTFKATQDGSTVTLIKNGSPDGVFQTSRDGGNTWIDYSLNTAITLNTGDEVSFRARSNRTSAQYVTDYCYFKMEGEIEAWHNAMSMYRTNDFATYNATVDYAFYAMFIRCTSLKKAPVLTATTLDGNCYDSMFHGCTSLVNAPVLPATTLAGDCYYGMFRGCTSLVNTPVLPATTLASGCYNFMFYGCTSLVNAPVLPATTLAWKCYDDMFAGCTSLKKAPVLTATTLEQYCYAHMFEGCSSLNEVHCKMPSLYSSSQISSYADTWLSGVSSTGTFYTNEDANWSSGVSGIPTGWQRVNEGAPDVDDITKPLTFRATQDGSTVKLVKTGSPSGAFQTSRDGGNTWSDYTIGASITLNTGDKVSFRAKADRSSAQSTQNYFNFSMKGKIDAWHNVMSLYRTNDFATYESVAVYAFYRLFRECTSLIKSPALPATTLASGCYASMFSGCTSLIKSPALPATTLASGCYQNMLWGCRSLTKAPALPATTLADKCYYKMLYGCSNLNEVHCNMPSSYSSSQIVSYAENWLYNVSSTGTFYTNADAHWASGASGIPTGWTRVNEGAPDVDDPNKPLMLRAIEDNSSVTLNKNGTLSNTYQTSTNGEDWTDYTLGTKISLNKGKTIYFRCSNHPTIQSSSKYVHFVMEGKIEAWHNAYSMIRPSFTNTGNSVGAYGMCRLFLNCKSLTKAPLLLNALDDHCYSQMFSGCTSLTQAPSLPATALASYCYFYMFSGCTSLTQAPSLPATNLANDCYSFMFSGCTSLTQAPSLPATNLASYCYNYMFSGCTSLTKTPSLPATTLKNDCYYGMFSNCSNLKEVRVSATTTATDALNGWLSAVSTTGDFYCDPNAKIFPTDSPEGIPSGWTRHALADYPTTT